MKLVTHMNYKDRDGQIYCCLRNKVVKLDDVQREQFCQVCKMFAGPAKDQGVECVWEDMRNVGDLHVVYEPIREFSMNQTRAITPDNFIKSAILFIRSDNVLLALVGFASTRPARKSNKDERSVSFRIKLE